MTWAANKVKQTGDENLIITMAAVINTPALERRERITAAVT